MTEQSSINEFVDATGNIRRCGTIPKPAGFVSAFPTFESQFNVWSDQQIQTALTMPGRRVARKILGDEWIPNQGPYGSCNGWAAANAFSRAKYLGDLADDTKYSGDWIYSLINGGRDNGSMLEDGLRVAQEVGFVSTADCPLGQIYPSKQKPGLKDLAARNKAVDCYAVETMQGLRTAGAAGFMLIVAVQVGSSWQRLDSRGISGVDRGQGNHAVCVDDMLILPGGPEVFDTVMDWGTDVGTRGKTYLTAQHFASTFSVHTFYAIPTGQRGLGV